MKVGHTFTTTAICGRVRLGRYKTKLECVKSCRNNICWTAIIPVSQKKN